MGPGGTAATTAAAGATVCGAADGATVDGCADGSAAAPTAAAGSCVIVVCVPTNKNDVLNGLGRNVSELRPLFSDFI